MNSGRKAAVRPVTAHGDTLEFLELAKEVLDQVAPLVDLQVNVQRRFSLWPLRDHHLHALAFEILDQPVSIKGLIGQQCSKAHIADQLLHAHDVVALARHQDELQLLWIQV